MSFCSNVMYSVLFLFYIFFFLFLIFLVYSLLHHTFSLPLLKVRSLFPTKILSYILSFKFPARYEAADSNAPYRRRNRLLRMISDPKSYNPQVLRQLSFSKKRHKSESSSRYSWYVYLPSSQVVGESEIICYSYHRRYCSVYFGSQIGQI